MTRGLESAIPVPVPGRFPDLGLLAQRSLPAPGGGVFSTASGTVTASPHCAALRPHSDEFVQVFHLFPFYPLAWGSPISGTEHFVLLFLCGRPDR